MAIVNVLGGILAGGGLIGAMGSKMPSGGSEAMAKALELIQGQYANIDRYYKTANTALEGQYKTYYGQTMQDAVDALAKQGLYGSPVAQKRQNRVIKGLADTYAAAKSQLAGQKMQAEGTVNAQMIGYYQNLANLQFQQSAAEAQGQAQMFSGIGGIGGALLGL